MKRFLVLSTLSLTAISCTHHHKSPEHHHHSESATKSRSDDSVAFDGKCPYAIMNGDLHTNGIEEYKLTHGSETYVFSSKENLEKFKKDLEPNINQARKRYARGNSK